MILPRFFTLGFPDSRLAQTQESIKKHIKDCIEFIDKQLEKVEKELSGIIAADEDLKAKKALLCSVKGIGEVTSIRCSPSYPN